MRRPAWVSSASTQANTPVPASVSLCCQSGAAAPGVHRPTWTRAEAESIRSKQGCAASRWRRLDMELASSWPVARLSSVENQALTAAKGGAYFAKFCQ